MHQYHTMSAPQYLPTKNWVKKSFGNILEINYTKITVSNLNKFKIWLISTELSSTWNVELFNLAPQNGRVDFDQTIRERTVFTSSPSGNWKIATEEYAIYINIIFFFFFFYFLLSFFFGVL